MEKLELTNLLERRIRGDFIKTFKITDGFSNYGRHFFDISPQVGNLPSRQISKIKSTKQLDLLQKILKIKLDYFRKNIKTKNIRGNFWRLLNELLNRISSIYIYIYIYIYI